MPCTTSLRYPALYKVESRYSSHKVCCNIKLRERHERHNLPVLVQRKRSFIPLHEKFLQFDWLRAVVFQLNFFNLYVIFGINTTRDISKLSQISLAEGLVKLRIKISTYHSWYLCQISLQIMLLAILIRKIRSVIRMIC